MKNVLKKSYLVNLLREAYLTKIQASLLYNLIRNDILAKLDAGETVNLFGIVNLVPYKVDKTFKGFNNVVVKDKNYRIKAVLSKTIKERGRLLNKNEAN